MSRAQERAQGGKDQSLVALFFDIVEEDVAQQVAGERSDASAAKPGGFAGAGQTDGQNDVSAGRLGRAVGGFRLGWRNGGNFGLGFKLQPAGVGGFVPFRLCGPVRFGGARRRRGLGNRRLGRRLGGMSGRVRVAGALGCRARIVRKERFRIGRNQRSQLIRWEFLADFACGFGDIGSASGASSHAAFNLCIDTRIPHFPTPLQIVCTASHTVPNQKRHPSGERFWVRDEEAMSFNGARPDRSVRIKGLVE